MLVWPHCVLVKMMLYSPISLRFEKSVAFKLRGIKHKQSNDQTDWIEAMLLSGLSTPLYLKVGVKIT